jgi:hypothetical protein
LIKKLTLLIIFLLGIFSNVYATPKTILVIGHSLTPYFIYTDFPPNGFQFNNAGANGAGLYSFWDDPALDVFGNINKKLALDVTYAHSTMAMVVLGLNDTIHVSNYSDAVVDAAQGGHTTRDKLDYLVKLYIRFFTERLSALGYNSNNTIIFNEWPISASGKTFDGHDIDVHGGILGDGSAAPVQSCSDESTCTAVSNRNHRYFEANMKAWARAHGYTYHDIWQDVVDKFDDTDWFINYYSYDGLHLFAPFVPCSADPISGYNFRAGIMCPPHETTVHEVYYWWVLPSLINFIHDKNL